MSAWPEYGWVAGDSLCVFLVSARTLLNPSVCLSVSFPCIYLTVTSILKLIVESCYVCMFFSL